MADTNKPLQEGGEAACDPYAGHTPIMRQYLMLKDKHPGVFPNFSANKRNASQLAD